MVVQGTRGPHKKVKFVCRRFCHLCAAVCTKPRAIDEFRFDLDGHLTMMMMMTCSEQPGACDCFPWWEDDMEDDRRRIRCVVLINEHGCCGLCEWELKCARGGGGQVGSSMPVACVLSTIRPATGVGCVSCVGCMGQVHGQMWLAATWAFDPRPNINSLLL